MGGRFCGKHNLLGASVLGDGLGTFGDGVLGQLARQQQTDGSLDFAGGDGRTFVVVSQTGSLSSDTLEDVIDEAVHDAHGLRRNSGIGMDLLQHLVDVDSVAFLPARLPLLLVSLYDGLLSLAGLLGGLSAGFRCHCVDSCFVATRKTTNDAPTTRWCLVL